ncbi:MAG: DUF3565 domain-containing protein [Herminiimonas sp.]|nr:DUF3565 domain-containing protein [Herminiimonas sp.]
MNTDAAPDAIPRAIVGYHQDEHLDRVGGLACGHGQHLPASANHFA